MFNRLLTVFWVVFFQRPCSSEQFFFKNFQGCITVYLSRYIFVVLAFPAATGVILTDVVRCVKHFFQLFLFCFFGLFRPQKTSPGYFFHRPLSFFATTMLILSDVLLFVNTCFCSFICTILEVHGNVIASTCISPFLHFCLFVFSSFIM